jgi:hypothetical protein
MIYLDLMTLMQIKKYLASNLIQIYIQTLNENF